MTHWFGSAEENWFGTAEEKAVDALRQVERRLVGDKAPDTDRRLRAYWENYKLWARRAEVGEEFAVRHLNEKATVRLVTLVALGELGGVDR